MPGRARVVVALAELVVLEPAVGVADSAAPPAGGALGELHDAGMVLRLAQRALAHVDVVELRERPQQLVARHRGARSRTIRPPRIAEERVGHVLRQRRAEWQVARVDLVDVDVVAQRQMPARDAHVGQPDAHVAGQLALHVHRVLMHARRVAIGIDEADVRAHAGQQARSRCPKSAVKPVGNGLSIVVIGRFAFLLEIGSCCE